MVDHVLDKPGDNFYISMHQGSNFHVHVCCVDHDLLRLCLRTQKRKEKGIIQSQTLQYCRAPFTPELRSKFTNYIYHEGDFVIHTSHLRKLRHSEIK